MGRRTLYLQEEARVAFLEVQKERPVTWLCEMLLEMLLGDAWIRAPQGSMPEPSPRP